MRAAFEGVSEPWGLQRHLRAPLASKVGALVRRELPVAPCTCWQIFPGRNYNPPDRARVAGPNPELIVMKKARFWPWSIAGQTGLQHRPQKHQDPPAGLQTRCAPEFLPRELQHRTLAQASKRANSLPASAAGHDSQSGMNVNLNASQIVSSKIHTRVFGQVCEGFRKKRHLLRQLNGYLVL